MSQVNRRPSYFERSFEWSRYMAKPLDFHLFPSVFSQNMSNAYEFLHLAPHAGGGLRSSWGYRLRLKLIAFSYGISQIG